MIKSFFKSLIPVKSNDNVENDNKILPKIPFYGVGGSICYIGEDVDCYYKVLYKNDGTVSLDKLPVPKRKNKTFKVLLEDYYNDVYKFLECSKDRYAEYNKSSYKEVLSDKLFYALAIVTALATVMSIPFIFSSSLVGVLFASISAFSLYMVCDIHKRDVKNVSDRDTFIKAYEICEKNLADYRVGNPLVKDRALSTVYTEIEAKGKIRDEDYPKIKSLTKEDAREVA